MVLSLLEGLAVTKGLKQALPFLTELVEAQPRLSARAIISQARMAGLSFGDQGGFNIVAQLKANLSIREQFRTTSFDRRPSISALERAVSPLSKNYSFLVSIRGFNPLTGEREQRHVTVVSDTLLTPGQVIETALSIPSNNPGSSLLTNSTVDIVSGKVSPLAL